MVRPIVGNRQPPLGVGTGEFSAGEMGKFRLALTIGTPAGKQRRAAAAKNEDLTKLLMFAEKLKRK
jgi:hypothetical protein